MYVYIWKYHKQIIQWAEIKSHGYSMSTTERHISKPAIYLADTAFPVHYKLWDAFQARICNHASIAHTSFEIRFLQRSWKFDSNFTKASGTKRLLVNICWVNSLRPRTHICVSKLTTIGWDNGLAPGRRQATISTNAGILLIGPLGTKFSEFLIVIHAFSFNKMHLKMSSAKWRTFCLGLNVLMARC